MDVWAAAKRQARFPLIERYIRGCGDRYFITLTTKRTLDPVTMSGDVSKVMQRVNRQLFGTHYTRRNVALATLAVQERSFHDGLHTHLLVGVPDGSLTIKANPCTIAVPTLILDTWTRLDEPGRRSAHAQDAREIYDFAGVLNYVTKDVHSLRDIDNVDVLNTYIPSLH